MVDKRTLLLSNRQYFRFFPQDFVTEAMRLGVTGIELYGMTPYVYASSTVHKVDEGLAQAVHAGDVDVEAYTPAPYKYSLLADPHSAQGKATVGYLRQSLDVAVELKAHAIVVDCANGLMDKEAGPQRGQAFRSVSAFATMARAASVDVWIAPCDAASTPFGTTLEDMEILTKETGAGAVLDVGCITHNGETINAWFQALGDRIKLVRLNDRNAAGPIVAGEGALPLRRVIACLEKFGWNGPVSLMVPGIRYQFNPFVADEAALHHLAPYLSR